MKKILSITCFAIMITFISSCNSISKNRENIKSLKIGMTKQQVLDVLGEPLKNETYHTPQVWFYHTDRKWMDGIITRDECTPIVFDTLDMVDGWGLQFYKKNVLFR